MCCSSELQGGSATLTERRQPSGSWTTLGLTYTRRSARSALRWRRSRTPQFAVLSACLGGTVTPQTGASAALAGSALRHVMPS